MIIFSLHLSQRLFLDFSLFHWRKDVVILFLAETTLLNLVSIIYWFVSSSFVESESYSLSGNRRRRRAEGKTPFFTGNRGEGPEATAALLVTCQISSRCVCAEWEMAAAAAGGGGKGGGVMRAFQVMGRLLQSPWLPLRGHCPPLLTLESRPSTHSRQLAAVAESISV